MRNLDKDTKYLDNIKIAYDKAKDPAVKVMRLKVISGGKKFF